MSKARLVITAVEIEGRDVAEVVETYGVSRSWVYELLARYRTEGEAAFEPRSRRPRTSPTAQLPAPRPTTRTQAEKQKPEPLIRGSGCPGSLERSHCALGGIRTPNL